VALDVSGGRADNTAVLAQPPGDEARIAKFPEANGNVEALGNKVDRMVSEHEVELDVGVPLDEGGKVWNHLAHAEAVAQAHP